MRSSIFVLLFAAALTLIVGGRASAQIVTYDTSSLSGTPASVLPTSGPNTNSASPLTRTSLTAASATGAFSSSGNNTTNTVNWGSQYLGFSGLSQPSGYALYVKTITVTTVGSTTAPNSYAVGYSTDNFTTNQTLTATGATSTGNVSRTFDILDLLTNDALSVRFQNFGATAIDGGASNSTGTFQAITPSVTGVSFPVFNIGAGLALAANTEIRISNALTISGTISGAFSVQKTGAGTLTLENTNTYTGSTTISAGTLKLIAGSGVINGSPTITVGSGSTLSTSGYTLGSTATQTLQGTGTVTGNFAVAAGSAVRGDSGTGTGTLAFGGNLTVTGSATSASAGQLLVTVSANATPQIGNTAADGSRLNLTATNAVFTFGSLNNAANIVLARGTNALLTNGTKSYTVVLATEGSGGSYVIGGTTYAAGTSSTVAAANYRVLSSDFDFSATSLRIDGSTRSLVLDFTPVPEPSMLLAVGAAGLSIFGWARRWRKTTS